MSSVINQEATLSAAAFSLTARKPGPSRPNPFLHSQFTAYGVAVTLTGGLVLLRLAAGFSIGDQPMLVVFLLPVILSAYLGGLGPGLLATFLGALEVDYFLMAPDGSLFLDGLGSCLNWSGFVVAGVLVSVLSEALRRARGRAETGRRFQALALASISDGIITADNSGNITLFNREAERLTGCRNCKAIGRPLHSVFKVLGPEEGEEGSANNTAEDSHRKCELLSCDGTRKPVETTVAPIRGADGKVLGTVVVFRDCSEQRKAEESIAEQLRLQEQLSRIAATAPGIIHAFRLRPDGTSCFAYANAKIEEIYGIPLEELRRDAIGIRAVLHPDDEPRLWASVLESKRTLSPWRAEFRVRHPVKGEIWVEVHSVPEVEPDGCVQWHGFMQDITPRKRVEANLEQANKELLEASRMAGMVEMATSVLHNVGNVLNSVNVAASLVADKVRQSKATHLNKALDLLRDHESDLASFLANDPKGRKIIPYLGELAARLGEEREDLLKQLGDLAGNVEHVMEIVSTQQNCAKMGGLRETLDITELVEDSLRMNGPSLFRRNIEVIRQYSKLPKVSVEKHKIIQILVNVIRNAQQACEDSGGGGKTLTVRLAAAGDRVRISITDNGAGIAPENLPKLFTRGFTTKKGGHGFGLHSSLQVANELGGTLAAQSEGEGKGATFTLELPAPPAGD